MSEIFKRVWLIFDAIKEKNTSIDKNPIIILIFVPTVPSKPLNNAQIGGPFYFILMASYRKRCTLPSDLIPLLESRGLTFDNKISAENYLWNIGYFRLSAYLRPLLKEPKTDSIFKEGVSFDQALNMYRFDRKLRLLLFNEIEKIEVAIRSTLVNIVSKELNDIFWMTDAKYFANRTAFNKSLDFINQEIGRTKEVFIEHFQTKYSDTFPPAWMIAEILPLGVLCNIYRNIRSISLRKKVALAFGLHEKVFDSWIRTLALIRNLCCHHARVWNKELVVTPSLPQITMYEWINPEKTDIKRIYIRLCIIKYLLFTVSPFNTFTTKLKDLLNRYPDIDIKAMGFPDDWETEPIWGK